MAFYYIKTGGTAAGDAGRSTTLRTGSFATMGVAAYYATVAAAVLATTSPALGDFILVSNTLNESNSAPFSTLGDDVLVMSVDDANAENYQRGARYTSSDSDYGQSLGGQQSVKGFDLNTGDDSSFGENDAKHDWIDVILTFGTGNNDALNMGSTNTITRFIDSDLQISTAATSGMSFSDGCRLEMIRCINTNAPRASLFTGLSTDNNMIIQIMDTDLTQFISASGDIFEDSLVLGRPLVKILRCKLPSGLGLTAGLKNSGKWIFDIQESDEGDGYHYFLYEIETGQAEEDIIQFLTASDAKYDDINGFSVQVDTTTLASVLNPFRYKLAIIPAQDIAAANQTVAVELTGPAALLDNDVWIEVAVQDNTDQGLGIIKTSKPANLLSGTALTSSSAVWETTTDTEYSISVDLGAFTNVTNTNVAVYLNVALPSITVNFDLPTIANT